MTPDEPPRDEPPNNHGLLGVAFAIVLVLGAIWLMNQMQHWAALSNCAFTHAPQCRGLVR